MLQKPIPSSYPRCDSIIEESDANKLGDAIRNHFSSLYKMNPEVEITGGGGGVWSCVGILS